MSTCFGERLRAYREFAGENQQELADALHVKVRTLRTWEHGIHNCSFEDLYAICQHYEISADWLLGLIPDDNPIAGRSQRDVLTFQERQSLNLFEEYLVSKHRNSRKAH